MTRQIAKIARRTIRTVAAAILAATPLAAFSQGYPSKPVHVIVSFTPGSATDIVARALGAKLSELWGQPVIADNRAGAGGSIGSAVVAKAEPDGYTLLINSSAHAINPAIYAKLPYDTMKDFVNIAPLAGQPNVLVVNGDSNIKSLAEFVAAAKAKPGSINFATAGIGSGTHLNLEKFLAASGIKVEHVPYKGTPDVIKDIMGGRVTCYFAPISAALSHIRGGRLRALAVTSAKRTNLLPDVPTVAESGFPRFEFTLWFGLWGPAGMPAAIVEKLNQDVNRTLATPEIKEQFEKLGNEPMHMTAAQFSKFVRNEMEDTMKIVRSAGIKPN